MSVRGVLAVAALCALAGAAAAAWCERADPAWRALRAPYTVSATALRVGSDIELRVRRVFRRPPGLPRWPRRGRVLRLVPDPLRPGCRARFEARPEPGGRYIVFAHGGAGRQLHALGPPLRETKKMLRRIRRVLAEGYIKPPKLEEMKSVRVSEGKKARFVCRASGRPPPRITWYLNSKPVEQTALRRLRVQTFRRRSVLVIPRVLPSDSGRVECEARGPEGAVRRVTADLTVDSASNDNRSVEQSSTCPMPNSSSYCMNGGTCLYFQMIGEFACKCPEGYEGQRCESKDVPHQSSMYKFTCKLGLSTTYYC